MAKLGVWVRRILIGRPLPSWRAMHERLPKVLALPVFTSDAMSSVAYATEEILIVLALAGAAATQNLIWVTLAIVALLAIVVTSYRQTIYAYPSGGGSYIVAKENLGVIAGLTAAAALLIDYTLTVAVSIASGVANLASAFPVLVGHQVELCVAFIAFICLANLRGLRESGTLFAIPAYGFIFSMLVLIFTGVYKILTHQPVTVYHEGVVIPQQPLTIFLLLRAFAGGCSAMTGTEAISNGIPAFKSPESKNAAITLTIMAVVLGVLFLGLSGLAQYFHILPKSHETVVSQVAKSVFGRDWFYYVIQIAIALILLIAAQTSFADFPRLSSILARDRFMPRQLANIGDRLVFNNGILALSLLASLLVIAFQGKVHRLIPLYAVGVFLSFTLSQAGMVVHTRRIKEKNWRMSAAISGIGAFVTGIVTLVVAAAKFLDGAFVVVILIPTLVMIFMKINHHYRTLADQLRLPPGEPKELIAQEIHNTVLLLVPGVHKGIIPALLYARSLSQDCRGVYIETDPTDTPLVVERWEKWGMGIPLVVLESPYRTLIEPILRYIDEVKKDRVRHMVTVIIPEFVPAKWWHKLLHNQSGFLLKWALMFKRDIVVTNIRYYLEK